MEENRWNQYSAQGGKKDNSSLIYTLLGAALLVSWGYFIYSKNKTTDQITVLNGKNAMVVSERDQVKDLYNASLARIDSIMGENQEISDSLDSRNTEIARLRSEIRKVLNNKNATAGDLERAKKMIAELNGRIEGLAAQVSSLQAANQELAATNEQISSEKAKVESELEATRSEKMNIQKKLDETEDIASTLRASGISIFAVNEKRSGKEVETASARRSDKFLITFNLDENKLAKSGQKEIYISVTGPDGKVLSSNTSFTTREEGEKLYTAKVIVNYEQGKKAPVSFNWRSENGFSPGNYTIEIYHNGYKIGEGIRPLK